MEQRRGGVGKAVKAAASVGSVRARVKARAQFREEEKLAGFQLLLDYMTVNYRWATGTYSDKYWRNTVCRAEQMNLDRGYRSL
jgi:hypothetical protein